MSNTKHTPGPWSFDEDWGRTPMVVAADGKTWIAAVQKQGGVGQSRSSRSPEQEANARLIAAAPDLLEALKRIEPELYIGSEIRRIASAAISKAQGASLVAE